MTLPAERELVSRWAAMAGAMPSDVVLGPGDDAALFELGGGRLGILTTDALVEDVHFRRAWGEADDLGWKAAAVNLSDIAAMGGRARYLVAATALPADLPLAYADGVVRGIVECARAFGASLIGGDTVASSGPYVISVTAYGDVDADATLRRDAARPGDVIAVTGRLGGAAAALRSFQREELPDPHIAARLLRPAPRLAEAAALATAGVRCAVDCSDGLARSLALIAERSGCAIEVDAHKVPVDEGATQDDALYGGEDYELVVAGAADAIARSGVAMTIGRAVAGTGVTLVGRDGARQPIGGGYDAFEAKTS